VTEFLRAVTQLVRDVSALVRTETKIREQLIIPHRTNLGRPAK
jgi:hypothetical protein